MVKAFFAAAGVTLTPPATLFWNDRSGVLFVKATMADLDLIEQAIQILNIAPPQITIDAKFIEVREIDSKALGFDWYLPARRCLSWASSQLTAFTLKKARYPARG